MIAVSVIEGYFYDLTWERQLLEGPARLFPYSVIQGAKDQKKGIKFFSALIKCNLFLQKNVFLNIKLFLSNKFI